MDIINQEMLRQLRLMREIYNEINGSDYHYLIMEIDQLIERIEKL